MRWEAKKFLGLALLWCSFCCCGLEPDPQFLSRYACIPFLSAYTVLIQEAFSKIIKKCKRGWILLKKSSSTKNIWLKELPPPLHCRKCQTFRAPPTPTPSGIGDLQLFLWPTGPSQEWRLQDPLSQRPIFFYLVSVLILLEPSPDLFPVPSLLSVGGRKELFVIFLARTGKMCFHSVQIFIVFFS